MSEGFELAPRPLAIFDAAGALVTQNEADRLCFGSQSLADRLNDVTATRQALDVALVDESYCKVFALGEAGEPWRVNFHRMRASDGEIAILAEFTDLPVRPADEGIDRKAVAAIAHDFRAPLTAIKGFAEFLGSGAADPERRSDYLAAIQSAATDLNDLADRFIAMRSAGASPLQLVNLNDLAVNIAAQHEVAGLVAGVKIQLEQDIAASPVIGDPLAIRRILQNLVSNALCYSGGASVTISIRDDVISVADDGVGMDPSMLDEALTPNSDTRHGGLGLVNCISLAASTGARIEFSTAPGAGFTARLSFAP